MKALRLALAVIFILGSITGVAAAANHRITLITMDMMDSHWLSVNEGAQKAADEAGNVTYNWLAPDIKDDAKQIEMINNAVAGGANAIILAANGPDTVTETLRELEAAGVTEGMIGIVNVNPATTSTVLRENGFRAALADTKFQILETQYGEGDVLRSKDIADNFITQGVVGLFGTNEGSSTGVGNSIKEAGDAVLAVGFDKSDALVELIKEGFLIATMAQNPDVMGYEGMKAAVAVLDGKEVSKDPIDTGVSVLTKDKL